MASNTWKYFKTSKMHEARRRMTDEQFKKCHIAIHTAAAAAAAAGAMPIPVADAIPISAAQITMVISLGKIFGIKVTESAASAAIKAAAATFVGRTVVKFIPVAGWIISGAVAGAITEGIGWMTALDFSKQAEKDKKMAEYACKRSCCDEYEEDEETEDEEDEEEEDEDEEDEDEDEEKEEEEEDIEAGNILFKEIMDKMKAKKGVKRDSDLSAADPEDEKEADDEEEEESEESEADGKGE